MRVDKPDNVMQKELIISIVLTIINCSALGINLYFTFRKYKVGTILPNNLEVQDTPEEEITLDQLFDIQEPEEIPADIVEATQLRSTFYFNYLKNNQLSEHAIYHIKESIVLESSSWRKTEEDAYLFLLGSSNENKIIVYENINEGRITYCFKVDDKNLAFAQKAIIAFFTSPETNKRECMMYSCYSSWKDWFEDNFYKYGIKHIYRISHKDQNSWVQSINYWSK